MVLGKLALICSFACCWISTGHAESVSTKERAARKACLSGDVAKGASILSELYVQTNDATYIYNQGRCFEQNGQYDEAILRFREYLRKHADAGTKPDAPAERHIADCQALYGLGPDLVGARFIALLESRSHFAGRDAHGCNLRPRDRELQRPRSLAGQLVMIQFKARDAQTWRLVWKATVPGGQV